MQRRPLIVHLLLCAACAAAAPAFADTFPSKAVVIKLAYPPGGPADTDIRDFLPALQAELGQAVVIENLPGANGSIAANAALQAAADGHTLLGIVASDLLLAPRIIATAKYKREAFRPIAVTGYSELVLVGSPKRAFAAVDDLVKYAKANPSTPLSMGHWGTGSLTHVAGAEFAERAGLKLLQVPYKGAAPVIPDLVNGSVDLTFFPLAGPLLGLIKSGHVKAIAIAANKRNPQLPDVPTLNETRVVSNFSFAIWSALFAPASVPEAVVARMNSAMNKKIASAEWRNRQLGNGATPLEPMTLQQLDTFYRTEATNVEAAAKVLRDPVN